MDALIKSIAPQQQEVIFYRDIDDLSPLERPWLDLMSSHAGPVFFQSLQWIKHVVSIRSHLPSSRWQICVATVWRDGQLIALWPLSLQREGLCWIARSLDDPFGQFGALLTATGEDPTAIVGAIIRAFRAERRIAGMMIERVPEGSTLHQALLVEGAKLLFDNHAVSLDLRPFDSFEAYLKTRRSKTRKNLRNARNRLSRDHQTEHDVVTGADDVRSIIDEALEGRLVWMQDNAKTAPAFRDPDFRRLLHGLVDSDVRDDLIGFRLRSGDTPISVQWGFIHGARYYAFISARNPAFDAYSPGRLHLGMVLEACFERDIEVVELMAPASSYKMNWTDQTTRIDDFGLALSTGGYLYLDLWRRHGRGIARRLYYGLPDGLRRHVANLTNRNRAS